MRVALIGTNPLSLTTAADLIAEGHDVVIVERDKERIQAVSESIDCGFIHGDGTRPAILREVGPQETEFLICLSDNDQSNILASLVGRSLGFHRAVTKIDDPEYEHICLELGLTETIVPHRTIARTLVEMVAGWRPGDISTYIKGDLRLFSFVATKDEAGPANQLKLPERCKVMCLYRNQDFLLPDDTTQINECDQIVLVTHEKNLDKLRKRWGKPAKG
ncbi:MAG: TrkA family potassium uptake protein [Alphaproteobacteria bacterium]